MCPFWPPPARWCCTEPTPYTGPVKRKYPAAAPGPPNAAGIDDGAQSNNGHWPCDTNDEIVRKRPTGMSSNVGSFRSRSDCVLCAMREFQGLHDPHFILGPVTSSVAVCPVHPAVYQQTILTNQRVAAFGKLRLFVPHGCGILTSFDGFGRTVYREAGASG
jgi:hypothetical protein